MAKKYAWKIWLIFWIIAATFLAVWYIFLQIKYRNVENLKSLMKIAPVGNQRRSEIGVLMDIYDKISGYDEEKTLLLLFQNDLELRPGGGFIGAFGIVKMRNGKIANIQVFDTGNFDKNISDTEIPSVPYSENSSLSNLTGKMRDSNWSPDFRENAKKAEYFYGLGGGKEDIDSVIAINTNVLNSILSVTGPVKIEGYPGEYKDENAILQLEYQVEKGYAEQGIEKEKRKNIVGELAKILSRKIQALSFSQQLELASKMESHLKQKDIQMYFKDENLQSEIEKLGWGGRVKDAKSDYLMVVDANLHALKSDYCIKRKMDYSVDLSSDAPQAVLNITYENTCRAKDWMTTNYRDWLRVYAPEGSFLIEANGQNGDAQYSDELGKKVFGMLVYVPLGESKTVTLKYNLPQNLKTGKYSLLIQKQSGSGDLPVNISVKKQDGSEVNIQETLTCDKEFDFSL